MVPLIVFANSPPNDSVFLFPLFLCLLFVQQLFAYTILSPSVRGPFRRPSWPPEKSTGFFDMQTGSMICLVGLVALTALSIPCSLLTSHSLILSRAPV
jgi:hypothetical protein